MRNHTRIDECIEKLCQKGCSEVWGDIDVLENGGSLPETQGLDASERRRVLAELKTVMAVYEGRCKLPD